jgi:hypothetical protein
MLALGACGPDKPRPVAAPPPRLADTSRGRHVSVSPPDWYWEPVFADGPADTKPIELPVTNDSITRVEGGARLWDDIGEPGREKLRRDGIVVLGPAAGEPPRHHLGLFYEEWREKRVPYVITLDALHSLVHTSLSRALAEIVEREIAPLLEALLARIDTRLAAEQQKGSSFDLSGGYRLARGVIAVARILADEKYVPAPDIAAVVREEQKLVDLHAALAPSPLFGVPVDYTRFAGPPKGSHRVLGWLSAAPFALLARTEVAGAPVDIGTARHHARAAMLLARLADREIDPQVHTAFSRVARLSTFVWGASDDLTPLTLGDIAAAGGVDLTKLEVIANVVRVDKLRALVRSARAPALSDGPSGATMRIFGAHAAPDSVALAGFASVNVLPKTLDLAAWLRTRGATDTSQLHASLHGSLVAALMTWSTRATPSKPADHARVESLLASWTLVRHTSSSFGRTKAPPPPPPGPREIRVSGAPLLAFVEPEPDAIAQLLATLRQARRGLTALGPMVKASPADTLLAETEDIVKIALQASARQTRDEPFTAEETTALGAIPSRIALLETNAAVEGGPHAAVIHSDPSSNRALVSASGAIEPALLLLRDPGTTRIVLAVGAHLTHFEAVERTDQLEGAAGLLERRIKEGKMTRASWTEGFRLAR